MAGSRPLTSTAMVFDDKVTTVYTVQVYELGTKREEAGRTYRFVKFDNGTGNVAAVDGSLCYRKVDATSDWTVTSDVSDVDSAFACGVFQSVPADLGFAWILTKGRDTVKTDGTDDIVLGDYLLSDASTDGAVERAVIAGANPTAAETRALLERGCGYALAADVDAANTVDAYLEFE